MIDYLPIGSIVLLKGGSKRLMIYGRLQLSADMNYYDYIGCFYPEGFINEKFTFLFNHDQIEEVVFEGFTDADELAFLNGVLNNPEMQPAFPKAQSKLAPAHDEASKKKKAEEAFSVTEKESVSKENTDGGDHAE